MGREHDADDHRRQGSPTSHRPIRDVPLSADDAEGNPPGNDGSERSERLDLARRAGGQTAQTRQCWPVTAAGSGVTGVLASVTLRR